MEDCVEFVENYTNKGKAAAIFEGYAYIKDVNLSDGKERYKCIYRSCHGYIWIRNDRVLTMSNGSQLGRDHNHEVEPERIEARSRLGAFKWSVKDQSYVDVDALIASTRDCEPFVSNVMPSVDLLKRMGRRMKRKEFDSAVRADVLKVPTVNSLSSSK
uniref:FLYWCH-type domain-containing protein n=1 Tax=Plectus sambesii TaxID=2011161 RepID=A0A914X3H6_9BILA